MAVRVVNLKNEDLTKILVHGFSKPIKNAQPYFSALSTKIYGQAMVTFDKLGSRAGNKKWPKLKQSTLHPFSTVTQRYNTNKWNKRYGTDGNTSRRYNSKSQSNILQASGSFRNSFKIIKTDNRRSIVGTKMDIAKDIMSNPDRPVLFVNNSDYKLYSSMFRTFIDMGIKF